ncbi:hypothetical protein AXF42_Ash015575 [Apostasia shenzhenica]|uniref:DUF7734 domain-containing protein n=1 Tax=Apostasia shenzhenica TaxID=1088818 RepID=A0A2I0AKL5_9ASPA|nr:hypothetical protein AXF42_Ash015575 [Apostasia shenzhenica]
MLIKATLSQVHRPWVLPPATSGRNPSPETFSCRRSSMRMNPGRRPGLRLCRARRRARYEEEGEEEGYGRNEEIAMLESYTESTRSEVLLVRATVDGEEEEVLVFKGYSSSLSSRTAVDPARSVLPAKAIIRSIDVIKGPFDPSSIEYLEKGLTWDEFKARLRTN